FMGLISESTGIGETTSRTGAAQGAVGRGPTALLTGSPARRQRQKQHPSLIEPVIHEFPAMIVTPEPSWRLHAETRSPALARAFRVLPVSSAPCPRYLTARGGGGPKYRPTK